MMKLVLIALLGTTVGCAWGMARPELEEIETYDPEIQKREIAKGIGYILSYTNGRGWKFNGHYIDELIDLEKEALALNDKQALTWISLARPVFNGDEGSAVQYRQTVKPALLKAGFPEVAYRRLP